MQNWKHFMEKHFLMRFRAILEIKIDRLFLKSKPEKNFRPNCMKIS